MMKLTCLAVIAMMGVAVATLPDQFDWRSVGGMNWLTPIRNQHVPHQCGSCLIVSAASMLSDRIKIHSKMSGPEVRLSAQVIKNCAYPEVTCGNPIPPTLSQLASGSEDIYKYMATNGIPDESCSPYLAADMECTPATTCYLCFNDNKHNTTCSTITDYDEWYVTDYGYMGTDSKDDWRTEIQTNGPVLCGITVGASLKDYKAGDVYMGVQEGEATHGHSVLLVGWGTDTASSDPYFIVKNSWGSNWGDKGFFKIIGDDRADKVFSECGWAIPSPTPKKA